MTSDIRSNAGEIMNLELKLFFFALLLLSTPLQGSRAHAQTKVYIGLSTLNSRVTPLWIAQEKGFFAKNGLEILLVLTRVSQPAIAGLLAGEMQMVYSGSSAALGAVAGGADLKVIAALTNRLTYDVVARPGIIKPLDLRGKKIGVGSIGGTVWMGAMLALEHLGLDSSRDQISILVVGDQNNNAQALESGSIEAALLDGIFTQRLRQKGFSVVAELYNANIPFAGQGVVATRATIQKQPGLFENFLKGLLEGIEFSLSPANKATVIKTMTTRLRLSDTAGGGAGLPGSHPPCRNQTVSVARRLRNVQRLMKVQNPRVANVKAEEMIDDRMLRNLLRK